jgi:hypothetical protein
MTKRYLWTILGAGLCFGASSTITAATAPDDWVCATWKKEEEAGECGPIKILKSLPDEAERLRHLVKGAKFGINFDGKHYTLELKTTEWSSNFLGISLDWLAGKELVSSATCDEASSDEGLKKLQALTKPAATTFAKPGALTPAKEGAPPKPKALPEPQYSHFVSTPFPLHLDYDDVRQPDLHRLYIYPIKDEMGLGKHAYCLSFVGIDGESHDGAVHGEG